MSVAINREIALAADQDPEAVTEIDAEDHPAPILEALHEEDAEEAIAKEATLLSVIVKEGLVTVREEIGLPKLARAEAVLAATVRAAMAPDHLPDLDPDQNVVADPLSL